jgi:hypothetical protein
MTDELGLPSKPLDPLEIRVGCTGTINGGQRCPGTASYRYVCPHGGVVNLLCNGHIHAMLRLTTYGACGTCGQTGTARELLMTHYELGRF